VLKGHSKISAEKRGHYEFFLKEGSPNKNSPNANYPKVIVSQAGFAKKNWKICLGLKPCLGNRHFKKTCSTLKRIKNKGIKNIHS